MSLSDIVSRMGLGHLAEIALVLCFVAFVALVVYTFLGRHREAHERARHLPLEDDRPASGEDRGSS
jgi:cbb3-type cytochrome oxidase subunit 3